MQRAVWFLLAFSLGTTTFFYFLGIPVRPEGLLTICWLLAHHILFASVTDDDEEQYLSSAIEIVIVSRSTALSVGFMMRCTATRREILDFIERQLIAKGIKLSDESFVPSDDLASEAALSARGAVRCDAIAVHVELPIVQSLFGVEGVESYTMSNFVRVGEFKHLYKR